MPKPAHEAPPGTRQKGPPARSGRPIDLHSHSWVSDGLRSPAELVERAARHGVHTLALTDHDTVDGVLAAQAAGRDRGVRVLAGVEISCTHRNKELHLLGLGIDLEAPELCALLREAQASRRAVFLRAMDRLRTCKAPLPEDLPDTLVEASALGRAHLGRALVEAGHTRTVGEAFARYLGEGRAARVHRDRPSLETAIESVKRAGGLPILAHPGGYPGPAFDLEHIREIAAAGIVGLEVYHPAHKARRCETYLEMASHLSLLVSGGSDHHGYPGDRPPGTMGLDEAAFAPLAERLGIRSDRPRPPGEAVDHAL